MESTSISVNLATLVGHGTVRNQAMGGSSNRKPTTRELQKMKDLVTRAMEQGALGLSTGLIYSPGEWASTEEIVELARIVASCNGLYASHMRGEGTNIFSSLNELFRVSREAGLPAHISHIKLSGKAAWGHADQVLALINKARDGGLDITQDQYVYTASSTSLGQVIPDEYKEGGKFTKNLADAAIKARMIEEMKSMVARGKRDDYSYAVIAYCRHNPALNGLNVAQAALKVRSSDSLDEQIELILDIQKNGGATGIFHGINEQDLQTFLQHPNTMFASDSGLRRFGEGVPHPRGYGNNARVLSHYVRELKLLRLEEAVRRMTCLPATTFHLKDRGLLREGAWADIAVFDPAKVQDESTFKEPHHYAIGFAYVLVNGTVVIDHDKHTGTRPGQAIRRGL